MPFAQYVCQDDIKEFLKFDLTNALINVFQRVVISLRAFKVLPKYDFKEGLNQI